MLLMLRQESVSAQTQNGSPTASYVCNFAKVKDQAVRGIDITVRSGAGVQFQKTDLLHSGREVYICDERGAWFKIVYSGPTGPCAPTNRKGRAVEKIKGCQSGWVEKKWLDVISG
jgi:hypothetical protein